MKTDNESKLTNKQLLFILMISGLITVIYTGFMLLFPLAWAVINMALFILIIIHIIIRK